MPVHSSFLGQGIIIRHTRYNNKESRLFMKWQCCFGFMVPAGLLWVFPELSLVRCERLYDMRIDGEMNICEFDRVRSEGTSV